MKYLSERENRADEAAAKARPGSSITTSLFDPAQTDSVLTPWLPRPTARSPHRPTGLSALFVQRINACRACSAPPQRREFFQTRHRCFACLRTVTSQPENRRNPGAAAVTRLAARRERRKTSRCWRRASGGVTRRTTRNFQSGGVTLHVHGDAMPGRPPPHIGQNWPGVVLKRWAYR